MATSRNAKLLTMSGERNPYRRLTPPGPAISKAEDTPKVFDQLGVVNEGAYADLLLVEGNPLENIRLIEDPDRNFAVIMKGGTIVKNIIPSG